MSIFIKVDPLLSELAAEIGTSVTKDRPNYPETLRTFEERRIDWNDGIIRKAIIIQPTFEFTGVNSELWNFLNVAWIDKIHNGSKPNWSRTLIEKQTFNTIEENINNLLKSSLDVLKQISEKDLHYATKT